MQHILGRVGIDVPSLQQHRFEGEVGGVFHQRFQKLPAGIAQFSLVECARILHSLEEHRAAVAALYLAF